jgi:arginyl-tRNA synthetase
MIPQKIINLIKKSLKKAQKEKKLPKFKIPEILVEKPEKKDYGDYASNIALKIGKKAKENPLEIAKILKDNLLSDFNFQEIFERVEIAEPGFLNFFLKKEYLQKSLKEILRKDFFQLKIGKGKKVQIEFISANPTGPLHIGNGRGAFFGDCLANLFKIAGYKVTREYFVNNGKSNTQIKILGKTALGKGKVYLTDYLKEKIKRLKLKLKKIKDEGEAGFLLANEIQKDIKDFVEKKLKIKFDSWVFEEDLYQKSKIKKLFESLKKKNLVYQKDKAWWLKTSKFGEKRDWVIIRETGEPTYFFSDICYHQEKFLRSFSKIINVWGADHEAHVSKILAAAKILNYKGDLDILICQLVTLKGKEKISKRKGKILTLEDLIEEIGLDVARFFYLEKKISAHMEIDLALAKEQSEKNPVFYIQYAHARISSILKKIPRYALRVTGYKLLNHPLELALIKQLIRFPEIIKETIKDYQVQRIPQYALDLATAFHQFYKDCRVLTEDKKLTKARLALILATKNVLKNTLNLMGISAPEKM